MAKQYVKFNGPYDYREITTDQWTRAGVKDHPGVIWNSQNNWRVPVSDLKLTDEQFSRIIEDDAYFEIIDEDGQRATAGQRYPAASS